MTEYTIHIQVNTATTVLFKLKRDDVFLTFSDVFALWSGNTDFIEYYVFQLKSFNYKAFYWEHPAVSSDLLHKDYECIVTESLSLDQLPCNYDAFKFHMKNDAMSVDFMNLGRNARLVVPTRQSDEEIYNHIGRFINLADTIQIVDLFKRIGNKVKVEIDYRKLIWLNTAGLGVIWLHVRLDTRPKYYKTEMYKNPNYLVS